MRDLKDMLGLGEVAKPYVSKVEQRHLRGQAIADQVSDRARQQHLASVRHAHDARGAIHRAAEEIAFALLDQSCMESATGAQRQAIVRRRRQRLSETPGGLTPCRFVCA